MGWVHPWVGLGRVKTFVGWVGSRNFGLGFEKVTHDQLCVVHRSQGGRKARATEPLYQISVSKKLIDAEQQTVTNRTCSAGADLAGGHSCSGRRGPWEAGPWRPPGLGATEG